MESDEATPGRAVGRVCGVLGVACSLVLPVASCGPVKTKGRRILRHEDPTGERGAEGAIEKGTWFAPHGLAGRALQARRLRRTNQRRSAT